MHINDLYGEFWLLTVSRWQREAAAKARLKRLADQQGECFRDMPEGLEHAHMEHRKA
jgi:hypothetical protein